MRRELSLEGGLGNMLAAMAYCPGCGIVIATDAVNCPRMNQLDLKGRNAVV